MELLKQRILRDGQVKEGGVLKVDSFLNHQMDVTLLNEIGREFRRRFDGAAITKIVTIEASGIGIAAIAAQHFGSVPVIFAKKTRSRNLDGALYTAKVHSFTKDITYRCAAIQKISRPAGHCAHPGRFPRPGTGAAGPHRHRAAGGRAVRWLRHRH